MPYDLSVAFEAIEDELISSMVRNLKRHQAEETEQGFQWEQWQALQLCALEDYRKRNQKKFPPRFKKLNAQIEEAMRKSYGDGRTEQERLILQAIRRGFKGYGRNAPAFTGGSLEGSFFEVNDRKLGALIEATTHDMERAEYAVLRRADDQYRQVIYNAQVYANTGAGTYKKAVDMATRDFLRAGLACVEYKNGSRHTLEDYADMAIKTAGKRAYLQGEGAMRDEWDIPTVIMNKRNCPCPLCAPFVGKVFIDDVWSGGNKDGVSPVTGLKYPLLSDAISQGLYHPRCKDVHTTYFEGVSTPPEGSRYTAEQLDELAERYDAEQRQGYCERQEKRYSRMSKYSLDEENQRTYAARAQEWGEKAGKYEQAAKTIHSISAENITENQKNGVEISDNSGIINYRYSSDVRAEVQKAVDTEYETMTAIFGKISTISSVEPLTWGLKSTYGEFNDNSGVLAIRFADKKDCLKKLAQKAAEMKKDGKWSTSHPMHVIRHEIGHAIQLEHMRNDKGWNEKLKKIKLIMDGADDKAVSLYAKDDIDEFISECIAESMTKKARKTSKNVVNVILGVD